ncbi:hypothetical protein E2986_11108 [Frieseomelitta varia]|uniref:Uncharacterized protein n=1 Tax=Frieseomelitta varia TaxID=561572 RepID=A0A833RT56_9HYME|nr:hypothetical protein E2986_11108 [Frieseomelitta varia]
MESLEDVGNIYEWQHCLFLGNFNFLFQRDRRHISGLVYCASASVLTFDTCTYKTIQDFTNRKERRIQRRVAVIYILSIIVGERK